jgi:hypothetical protein
MTCKDCGFNPARQPSGLCVSCWHREYYQKNKERLKQYSRDQYWRNPEKYRAYTRAYKRQLRQLENKELR